MFRLNITIDRFKLLSLSHACLLVQVFRVNMTTNRSKMLSLSHACMHVQVFRVNNTIYRFKLLKGTFCACLDVQVFRVKAEPPRNEWQGQKMTMRVTESSDLWVVLCKSQFAT